MADVTASYTGKAAGISVRDKTSGHFTANVDLTATFGGKPDAWRDHLRIRRQGG